jgi:hypothetical protein
MSTASNFIPIDEGNVIEPVKRQAVTVELSSAAPGPILGSSAVNLDAQEPALSAIDGSKERRDAEIAKTLGQNRTPALIGVVAQRRAGNENPAQRFLLNNYCSGTGITSGSQSIAEDLRTHNALLQRARLATYLAGEPGLAAAEEVLSRTYKEIGHSHLHLKFQPRQRGLKAYVNRIIQRKAWKVIEELRSLKAMPITAEIESPAVDPARAAELKELPKQFDQRLARAVSEARVEKPFKEGSSTPYGRKRRERLRKWKCMKDLFPGMRFRPAKHR